MLSTIPQTIEGFMACMIRLVLQQGGVCICEHVSSCVCKSLSLYIYICKCIYAITPPYISTYTCIHILMDTHLCTQICSGSMYRQVGKVHVAKGPLPAFSQLLHAVRIGPRICAFPCQHCPSCGKPCFSAETDPKGPTTVLRHSTYVGPKVIIWQPLGGQGHMACTAYTYVDPCACFLEPTTYVAVSVLTLPGSVDGH